MAISSEFVAQICGGILYEKLGALKSIISCFLISGIGGIAMICYGLEHPDSIMFPILFLTCRFGVSAVGVQFTVANARIFDVEKSSTAFGLGSFFGRMVLSAAPIISTIEQPVPMYIFTLSTIVAAATTLFVKVHPLTEIKKSKVKV